MKKWKEFTEALYSDDEKTKKCPKCGEEKDLLLLGPKDYKRDEHGNYRRTISYQCNKCKSIFSVDKLS